MGFWFVFFFFNGGEIETEHKVGCAGKKDLEEVGGERIYFKIYCMKITFN